MVCWCVRVGMWCVGVCVLVCGVLGTDVRNPIPSTDAGYMSHVCAR